ncbi:PD-(D/E)XK nuclease family protein [Candidatus Kaiserbacteria bacterium]|nr:PD-(D/E)XK nuclease family protein [Candidatus Kaiserbacteria bacterium]
MEFGGTYKVRERGLFDPQEKKPFSISRTKIENFLECPRCSYLDLRFGVGRPDTPSFTLNNAVDELLKKEFDTHRANGSVHPLLKTYGLNATPLQHKDLELWRDARFNGIKYVHEPTNFLVRGGIDDVWKGPDGKLIVVDYKATSKKKEIELYASYKRQAEVYQWLFRRNGFDVSDTAYFVYVNGKTDLKAFDGKLEFDVSLIPHEGDDSWVEPTLMKIKEMLLSDQIPSPGERCDYCPYREASGKTLQARTKKKSGQSTLGI